MIRKKLLISILLLLWIPTSLYALTWAYPFVVLDGRVYEVTSDQVDPSDVGLLLGQVTKVANEQTGSFHGNASNQYPVGTKYFKMDKVDEKDAIAVKADQLYYKATFIKYMPFHWRNILSFIIPMLFLISLIFLYRTRENLKKRYKHAIER
ncbi:hypothetical protein [Gracilibacillus salinarum]|uniref:Uncharacterized protein n=1 Tax=Gracilibacillus salinarum TaxID=2932255 RepID=A0ABY4GQN9_9BACI|nr:hypothetical protein [Gracilibacillus salinarum]UOQ86541.1 hypothetical protein MUN87_06545 [Gracilibacillus salinarum]